MVMYNEENSGKILDLLYEYNPWWRGQAFEVSEYRTRWFSELRGEMESPEIEIIYGPRQVGKTVLMRQLVKQLLEVKKVAPRSILYISMDHASIGLLCTEAVKDLLEVYSRYILPPESKKAYIFLDEIQAVERWSNYLKQYYDQQYPAKFFVSGSSSTEIEKGSSESLLGRSRLRLMLQWSFADFINFALFREGRGVDLHSILEKVSLIDALQQGKAKSLFEAFAGYRDELLIQDIRLENYILDYLVKGGYPSLAEVDFEYARDVLMERFALTIHKDIMRTFAVRNIRGLENVVTRTAMQSGQLTDYHGFAKAAGLKYDTFIVYLGYLLDVFLLSESHFYSKSDSTFKKGKKLYLRDHATRNVLIGLLNRRLFEFGVETGKTAETVVQDHASRLVHRLEGRLQTNYWKGKKEVDIIITLATVPIPIEVKYQETPDDIGGVREFIEKFGSPFGLVVTKDTFRLEGDVLFVPLHLFLAVC